MARFYGKIGFAIEEETRPGIYEEVYKEVAYKGNIVRRSRQWSSTDYLNDDLEISNDISVIANDFMLSNLGAMRYVYFMGQKISIKSAIVDPDVHRVSLSLGGVFNGRNRDNDTSG